MKNLLNIINSNNLQKDLFKGLWGLEKENLRVDDNGYLALTPHPKSLGDKLTHPYITTDFSESQIEIITPPNDSIDKTYSMLENLHEIVSENLPENEYLWPSSMPPIIPDDDLIPIANYGDSDEAKEKVEYREYISKKYGKHKQLISGIHYNFSFNSDFLQSLHKNSATDQSFKDFKNDIYLTVARNLLKHQWLITYLMGANIAIHSSYKKCCDITRYEKGDEYHFKNACSFRNSICGYRNKEDFRVSYDNIDDNIKDLKKLISTGQLHGANEYYSPVRLKNPKSINGLDALEKDGIEYIELRMIDLNPLSKIGITKDDIYLIHLIIISSLLYPCSSYNKEEQATAIEKQNLVSLYGNKLPPHLIEEGLHFFKRMEQHLDDLSQKEFYEKIIKQAIDRINGNREIYSTMIYNMVDSTGYINHHLSVAKHNKKQSSSNKYALKGYEDLELSTQILIREALLKGLKVEVLDRTENFISIKNDTKIEYIKQATKTSLDPYSTALIMENKAITKKVLMDNNITVPNGGIFTSIDDAKGEYSKFKSKKVVIKPNNTNFGLGITILDENFSIKDYTNGLEIAFNHDKTILIEDFFYGEEYRFTIIDGVVEGILKRVPANVIGDGNHSIKELINIKNENPLRGTGYKKPLEKLKLGESELFTLRNLGMDDKSIPDKGKIIYLRENSNISTGGDSLDFTDSIDQSYKDEAVEAAKAVGANITGVDMMIQKIDEPRNKHNSTIIELNFNPAIHIHCFPYKGKNRRLGRKILEALGF